MEKVYQLYKNSEGRIIVTGDVDVFNDNDYTYSKKKGFGYVVEVTPKNVETVAKYIIKSRYNIKTPMDQISDIIDADEEIEDTIEDNFYKADLGKIIRRRIRRIYDRQLNEMKEQLMKRGIIFCTIIFAIYRNDSSYPYPYPVSWDVPYAVSFYDDFYKATIHSSLEQAHKELLYQLNVHMRVEVDDDDEEQAFNVPAWLDDVPTVDIIAQIVDPQGQGRVVQNLVNAAGDVLNSINPFSFYQFLANECCYSMLSVPKTDFCMRFIANWGEPRIN